MDRTKLAIADLAATLSRVDLAWELASDDIKQRYRRTALGPLWVVIGIGLWVAMTGFIGMTLFNADAKAYFTNVAIGMVLWIFVSNMINEGTQLIQQNGHLILNTNIPISLYLLRMYIKHILLFAHYLIIPVVIITVIGAQPSWQLFLIIPSFVIFSISGLCLVTIFCFLCARYRDMQQAVVALMQIMPLVTPILWSRDFLPDDKKWIADVNPLYHYINIIKAPVASAPIEPLSYMVVGISTLVLITVAWLSFVLFNKKSAYWI